MCGFSRNGGCIALYIKLTQTAIYQNKSQTSLSYLDLHLISDVKLRRMSQRKKECKTTLSLLCPLSTLQTNLAKDSPNDFHQESASKIHKNPLIFG
jgi:hypothetical protein